MASDKVTKVLEIEVQFEAALQQIAKYRTEIDATKERMAELKRQHKEGSVGTAEYQQTMAACTQAVKANQTAVNVLTKQVQTQIQAQKANDGSLKQLRASLSDATREYDAMSRAERNSAAGKALKDKINDITRELKAAEQETQRFYRNVGNYKEATDGLEKVENKVKGLGKAMLALAGIMGLKDLGKQLEEVGSAYADQMGKVKAVTNASAVEFAMMSQEVEKLGSTTRYTAQEAGEAMENLTRNGMSATDATRTLEGVLHLAQANAIELGEAADIVTGQMNAFHLKTSDVAHINDVLSYACANSATNISQLNEGLRNTAPIAYSLGVSIEETTAALSVLADNNIKGADSGTILKQTFNGLMTSTNKSRKVFEELGLNIDANTVKSQGLTKTLAQIMEKAPTEQQLADIFGRKAVAGVLALTSNLDLLQQKFQGITESAEGTADRMFEQSFSKFTLASKGLQSAWEGLLISVWEGTNLELREKFVEQLNELNDELEDTTSYIKTRYDEVKTLLAQDPNNASLKAESDFLATELEAASAAYESSKRALSEQMIIERSEDADLIASWRAGAIGIEDEYLPAVERAKEEYNALLELQAQNPKDKGIKEQIEAKAQELQAAVTAYDSAREQWNSEWVAQQIADSGDDALIEKYQKAADAITNKYVPAIEAARAQVEEAKAKLEENPADEEAALDLEAKTEELMAAEAAYAEAQAGLNEEYMSQVSEAPGGLAELLAPMIESLTSMLQWLRKNADEVGKAIMAIIAGITLTKLITHVKASAATMKSDLIASAQNASIKVQELEDKEASHRQRIEQLKVQYAQTSGQEQTLIANKLAIEQAQLTETQAQLVKAKATEMTTHQQAAAATTATGWKASMQSCGLAVQGFINTAKAAMKSFALMAVISLLIEGIMKLWEVINSGVGPLGNIGSAIKGFVSGAIDKLKKAIVDVINWFIDLYNNSMVVRLGIAMIQANFKAMWTVLKAGVSSIINSFKLLGNIVADVAKGLKALFSLNFSGVASAVRELGSDCKSFFKEQKDIAVASGKEIAEEYKDAWEDAQKKIDNVTLDAHNTSASAGGGKGGNGGGTTASGGGGTTTAGGGNGGGGGGGSKGDKGKEDLEKQQKKEAAILAAYEAEKYKILEDGAEKRRQAVESEYNKRIAKLKATLETEKNLSEEAKQALNAHIELLEIEKAQALEKLSKEEVKRVYEAQVKNNEAHLALIQKQAGAVLSAKVKELEERRKAEIEMYQQSVANEEQLQKVLLIVNRKYDAERLDLIQQTSGAELMLQISNAQKKRDAAIQAATEEIKDEDERNRRITEIEAEYEQARLGLVASAGQTEFALRLENLDKKHELAVQAAEDEIAIEEQKLKALAEISEEAKAAMSDDERARYELQVQEATQQLAIKNEALQLINEQYRQDEAALHQQAYDASIAQQRTYLQDRIAALDVAEMEYADKQRGFIELSEEERAADIDRKLQSIGGFEAEKLRLQYEAAEAELEALKQRGQLAGQSEEEFQREMTAKQNAALTSKKKIDEAYVKTEQAKYQSMKSVTSSLTGLLDTLGESNKSFAIMSKVITLAQIAIDTGKALSAGIASASGVPFPGNLAAIATTVATVIANITTAISTVKSAKFAKGGKVNGPGTATSDSVPAMLSNGEFVMTAAATRIYEPLLMAMNNIGAGIPMQVVSSSADRDIAVNESLTESFTEAAKQIQPVVSVVEINETQDRIKMIEERSTF